MEEIEVICPKCLVKYTVTARTHKRHNKSNNILCKYCAHRKPISTSSKVDVCCIECNIQYNITFGALKKHKNQQYRCIKCIYASKKKQITVRSLIAIKCSCCLAEYKTITIAAYNRRKNKSSICEQCLISQKKPKLTNEEISHKLSENAKLYWKTVDRDKRSVMQSEITKKLWKSKEFRNKVASGCKIAYSNNDYKLRRSDISKELWKNKDFRDKISKAMLKKWQDLNFRSTITLAQNKQPIISKQHLLCIDILKDMGISYQIEYVLGPWSFDIYLPDHNILLEINGDWIHSQPHKHKADVQKATYIKSYYPNLTLKYLWEHEFYNIGRITDLLSTWCGINKNIEFNLNDVTVKLIDFTIAQSFINKYHYIGNIGRYGQYVGAYINDMLIAVCVFAPCTRREVASSLNLNYDDVYELTRFCIHPLYHKKNFGSWFLSRCVKNIKKQWLVSFADGTYNHQGTIYKASNWKLVKTLPPDYWYVKDNWVIHKKTLWNRANNLKLTESEFAEKYGYNKVWGREKYKYLYHNV